MATSPQSPPPMPSPAAGNGSLLEDLESQENVLEGLLQDADFQDFLGDILLDPQHFSIPTLECLRKMKKTMIPGRRYCQSCQQTSHIKCEANESFTEVLLFLGKAKKEEFQTLQNTSLLPCPECREERAEPVVREEGKVNWLFLFLSRSLAFCTTEQLTAYCLHRRVNPVKLDDRNDLLRGVYFDLYRQLLPQEPFHKLVP